MLLNLQFILFFIYFFIKNFGKIFIYYLAISSIIIYYNIIIINTLNEIADYIKFRIIKN